LLKVKAIGKKGYDTPILFEELTVYRALLYKLFFVAI
jgi:hypothetical protein